MTAPNRAERVTTSGGHPADTALAEIAEGFRVLANAYVEIVQTIAAAISEAVRDLREAGVISPETLREDRK